MKIVRRYLMRTVIGISSLVLLVLLSVGGFIEFISQLDDIGIGDYTLARATVWVLLKLPNVISELLPVAVLMGALLGLGTLAGRSELVVLRASGVSPAEIGRAVFHTGIWLGLGGLLLAQLVAPQMERFARQYRAEAKYGQTGLGAGESAWIREGPLILNVRPPAEEEPAAGVLVFRLDGAGGLAAIGEADSVRVDGDDNWYLSNLRESLFTPDAVAVRRQARSLAVAGINPDLLGLTVVKANTLSGFTLYRYIAYLQRNGLDSHRYEVAFWSRFASAVAVALMCMLAVPFVLGPLRSAGAGARLVAGLAIGLAWYLMSRTLIDGAEIWCIQPWLVSWLPTLILAGVTALASSRAR